MNLKGGVIIIGSLLWDNDNRSEWRKRSLDTLDKKIPVPLKICYGRESSAHRHNTYTMVFSNNPFIGLGQGYIVKFKNDIKSKEMLKEQAFALAKAEGIWTNKLSFLGKNWGAVGLLVNENKAIADFIKLMWNELFQKFKCDYERYRFDHSKYCIKRESPVIDENGFLDIEWPVGAAEFDFLLATPTVPKPKRILSAKEIAERMIEKNYKDYFENNKECNITTYQDDKILKHLQSM